MKEIAIYPYKMGSASAKLLAKALDAWRVYPDREFKPTKNHLVVNWGNGYKPRWDGKGFIFLNRPEVVNRSIEKITTFELFSAYGVSIPEWSQSISCAKQWMKEGHWVVCRTNTEGMDGRGLVLAKTLSQLVQAPLYTKYIPIAQEFRVYVFKDEVLDVLEKRRDSESLAAGKVDPDIRTEHNNWVFCRSHVIPPKGHQKECIAAIKALDLDFGGVDLVLGKDKKLYVLETNTAPGIFGTTVSRYADAIKRYAEEK